MPSLYIDGAWVASADGALSQVINPSDATVVTEVDVATDDQVQAAIAAARRAFDTTDWPRRPAPERAALLERVAGLIDRDLETMASFETMNTGKAMRESRWDMADVARAFRYFARLAAEDPTRIVDSGNPDAISRIVYEPVGVCALIGPWNYPLLQMSWKIAPALAAGNTAIMKPAQVTPLTAIHLTTLLEEAGVPPGVANLVLGPGDRVGQALADSPEVDLISLTGGLEAGRALLHGAAVNLKKVALELGGKSPNIIFDDADIETAVDHALTAAFTHSGQVCSAGCRAIVQDTIYDRFVKEVGRRADRIRLGHGDDDATEAGALISAAHRAKVEAFVAGAIEEGARLVAGGRRPAEPELQAGFFYRPTVFADVNRDMRVIRQEVFGPVLTVERFTTEDEAIALGNDTTY
ncbi:MAG: aldehyde dehydrogenase family protein, partial [Chloroflexota bacterium]